MSSTLEVPICSVNTASIRHLSTSTENLHSIWSVFSKCADSLEDGKRLENLSWRIWTRETICCTSSPRTTKATSLNIPPRPKKANVPQLSESVDSISSDESIESEAQEPSHPQSKTAPLNIHVPSHQESLCSIPCRERQRRISPLRLERMVESIQEKQGITALSPSIVNAVPIPPTPVLPVSQNSQNSAHATLRSSDSSSSTAPLSSPESDQSATQTLDSDTSAELLNSHHVIRGFSPNQTSSSYRSKTHLAPAPPPAKPIIHSKHTQPNFTLGGSSGEDESSFEEHMPSLPQQSSLTVGLKKPNGSKKQTSFKDEIVSKKSYEDEEVFIDSDEEDSSAIDDDSEDDDNWEEASENEDAMNEGRPIFSRVDSKPNLVTRRSLLTTQLHEGDRQTAFAEMAQSQAPLRKARTQVRMDSADSAGLVLGPHMKRSKPISMASSNAQATPIAFSPRTTRRHMLATEMTESLRKAVLFERQQKKATASAVLKRNHTTADLTSIRDYPEGEDGEEGEKENHSWNDEYSSGGLGDYHQTGW